jgi:hypothetical protein
MTLNKKKTIDFVGNLKVQFVSELTELQKFGEIFISIHKLFIYCYISLFLAGSLSN